MRRAIAIILVALAALLVGSQLILPRYLEGRIEGRLTEDGGTADVSLDAFPAARLLTGDGDRIEVRASGLSIDLAGRSPDSLERLDGFDEVDVSLTDVTAGPFQVGAISLMKPDGSSSYSFTVDGTVSARELSRFAAGQVAGTLGGLFSDLATSVSPLADAPIPVDLAVRIGRVGDRWQVTGGAGTIAGLPAGPVVEVLAAAVVARL